MNVYDFDGTIYDGDSTLDFYLYCIKKSPSLLKYFPKQIMGFILYKLKRCEKSTFKETFFIFLSGIEDIDKVLHNFWEDHKCKIKSWYLDKQKQNDLIISASPEFLLDPVCKDIGISNLIASRVDKKSGKFYSPNCYGEEKVRRLNADLKLQEIEEFYSDSLSDYPLAKISKASYLVKGNSINKWELK